MWFLLTVFEKRPLTQFLRNEVADTDTEEANLAPTGIGASYEVTRHRCDRRGIGCGNGQGVGSGRGCEVWESRLDGDGRGGEMSSLETVGDLFRHRNQDFVDLMDVADVFGEGALGAQTLANLSGVN